MSDVNMAKRWAEKLMEMYECLFMCVAKAVYEIELDKGWDEKFTL